MSNYIFTIDTLQFSRRLQSAGLGAKIADEISEAIKDTQAQSLENVATKQDIREIKQDLKEIRHDLQILEQKFDQKIESLEQKFDQKIDSLEQKFDQKIDFLDQKIDALEQKFDQKFLAIDQRFETFEQKFETLEYKLTVKMFVAVIAAVSIVTWLDKIIG